MSFNISEIPKRIDSLPLDGLRVSKVSKVISVFMQFYTAVRTRTSAPHERVKVTV